MAELKYYARDDKSRTTIYVDSDIGRYSFSTDSAKLPKLSRMFAGAIYQPGDTLINSAPTGYRKLTPEEENEFLRALRGE